MMCGIISDFKLFLFAKIGLLCCIIETKIKRNIDERFTAWTIFGNISLNIHDYLKLIRNIFGWWDEKLVNFNPLVSWKSAKSFFFII